MRTTVYGTPSELLVDTVTLAHDHQSPENTFLFRCHKCGSAISKIQGRVTEIFPGYIASDDVAVINKCIKCPKLYTFQTKESKRKYTRVTLSKEAGGKSEFMCVITRTPLLRINGDEIVTILGKKVLLPYTATVLGNTYTFADLV